MTVREPHRNQIGEGDRVRVLDSCPFPILRGREGIVILTVMSCECGGLSAIDFSKYGVLDVDFGEVIDAGEVFGQNYVHPVAVRHLERTLKGSSTP